WTAESSAEVKPHPAATQIVRLAKRALINDGAGKAKRHTIELPVPNGLLDLTDHPARGHGGARWILSRLLLSSSQHLDVCAADIDDKNLWRFCNLCGLHRCSFDEWLNPLGCGS